MVTHGEVTRVDSLTDKETGEEKTLVYVEWWGGSKYFVVSKGTNFDRLKVGQRVEIYQSYSFGKNGARPSGDPMLTTEGKVVA